MLRSVFGVGVLCVLFCGEASYARRVTFDSNYDGGASATVSTRVLPAKGTLSPIEIDLHVSGIDIDEDQEGFHRIAVDGLYENAKPGEPALSSSGVLLAVPEGFRARAEVLSEKEETVGDVYVTPFQPKSRCHSGARTTLDFNAALYESNTAFPAEKLGVEEIGSLQGVHLVRVGLRPVQAQLADRSLKVTTDLKVRVTFEATKGRAAAPIELSPALYDLAVGSAANRSGLNNTVTRGVGEMIVIVTADALKPGLASLVKWFSYKGIQSKVITVSEAGGTKEGIKATLQRLYNAGSPKPSYLLMVGNQTTAPAYMEKVKFEGQTAVTDYPYSLLSGTDIIPDILYGRLLADNAAELKAQVDRWIQYEAFPERGAAWYGAAATVASREGSKPSDKDYALEIGKALKAGTYRQVDGLFEGDKTATAANINTALTQGRSWISYIGHGSGTAWQSTNDSFSVNEVSRLQNFGRLPVVVDVACLNADYVRNKPCFGKAWVTAGSGNRYSGAVAYYGGSVSISWHPPAIMSIGIAKSHFEKGLPSIGASVLGGQLYLIQQVGANQDAKDNLTWYNLFGNPAMHLRDSAPRAYKVQTQAKASGGKTTVLVQATDTSGRGVAGLRAAALASDGTTLLDAGTTDNVGRVTVTVDTRQAAGMSISTTGYNAEAYKVAVTSR